MDKIKTLDLAIAYLEHLKKTVENYKKKEDGEETSSKLAKLESFQSIKSTVKTTADSSTNTDKNYEKIITTTTNEEENAFTSDQKGKNLWYIKGFFNGSIELISYLIEFYVHNINSNQIIEEPISSFVFNNNRKQAQPNASLYTSIHLFIEGFRDFHRIYFKANKFDSMDTSFVIKPHKKYHFPAINKKIFKKVFYSLGSSKQSSNSASSSYDHAKKRKFYKSILHACKKKVIFQEKKVSNRVFTSYDRSRTSSNSSSIISSRSSSSINSSSSSSSSTISGSNSSNNNLLGKVGYQFNDSKSNKSFDCSHLGRHRNQIYSDMYRVDDNDDYTNSDKITKLQFEKQNDKLQDENYHENYCRDPYANANSFFYVRENERNFPEYKINQRRQNEIRAPISTTSSSNSAKELQTSKSYEKKKSRVDSGDNAKANFQLDEEDGRRPKKVKSNYIQRHQEESVIDAINPQTTNLKSHYQLTDKIIEESTNCFICPDCGTSHSSILLNDLIFQSKQHQFKNKVILLIESFFN